MTPEQLAQYLPHKLNVQYHLGYGGLGKPQLGFLCALSTRNFRGGENFYWVATIRNSETGQSEVKTIENFKLKPILHPLSDLTKEITVEGYGDGEPFVPINELQKLYPASMKGLRMIDHSGMANQWMLNTNRDGEVSINIMRLIDRNLACWHFDHLFDLIEKGEAIDINTLK